MEQPGFGRVVYCNAVCEETERISALLREVGCRSVALCEQAAAMRRPLEAAGFAVEAAAPAPSGVQWRQVLAGPSVPQVPLFTQPGAPGLLDEEGERSELFFLVKAFWCEKPFVYLCGHKAAPVQEEDTEVVVYSNLPTVTLLVNGRVFEKKQAEKVFVFSAVPVKAVGRTIVAVQNGLCRDSIKLQRAQSDQ